MRVDVIRCIEIDNWLEQSGIRAYADDSLDAFGRIKRKNERFCPSEIYDTIMANMDPNEIGKNFNVHCGQLLYKRVPLRRVPCE